MTENELFELIDPALPSGCEWEDLGAMNQAWRAEVDAMDPEGQAQALLESIKSGEKESRYYETWVPPQDAMSLWARLRGMAHTTGYWPVIVGATGESGYNGRETAAEIVAAAEAIDGEQWMRDQRDPAKLLERARAEIASMKETSPHSPMIETRERLLKEREDSLVKRGDSLGAVMQWPEKEHPGLDSIRLSPSCGFVPESDDDICIALVPGERGWEVPAYLDFGNWNACPEPAVHVAVLRHWHEAFGAELVMMERDTLQLSVERPPLEREDAWHLAIDQSTYAEFEQLGTLGDQNVLASALRGSPHWCFWWD